ncbi:hypothetical protein SAMN04487996_10426 [Dyadobacter soli]|uniref:Uncharacterized protein n=1 Tax=Dyadobacter soli TaxID=659014 RepID=A0A1G7B1Y6_9BACT|nr:hypothetical protein [Dyadobacter soli]SDE20265.1 hypothetical protein SAMN04487996_10426 [Dyadobacter soli]
MEALTAPQSNVINQVILVVIMLAALVRLADGLREFFFERVTLLAISVGAFFLLASNADPAHIRFTNGVVHSSVALASYAMLYIRFKTSDTWISQ